MCWLIIYPCAIVNLYLILVIISVHVRMVNYVQNLQCLCNSPLSTTDMGIFQRLAGHPLQSMCIWSLWSRHSSALAAVGRVTSDRALIVTSCQLTQHRYVHRGGLGASPSNPGAAPPRLPFSRVTHDDLAFFRTLLPGRTITDPDLLKSSNVDWLKTVEGELFAYPKE